MVHSGTFFPSLSLKLSLAIVYAGVSGEGTEKTSPWPECRVVFRCPTQVAEMRLPALETVVEKVLAGLFVLSAPPSKPGRQGSGVATKAAAPAALV